VLCICTVSSVFIAFSVTPTFLASVLLAPASNENHRSSGIASIANQFGGLAGLAGISVGGSNDIEIALATLSSRKFITRFITDLNLKPILFRDKWDASKKIWLEKEPSYGESYKKFREKVLNISRNRKTQLITLSVEWENPVDAAKWANALVTRINNELRQQTIEEAERSISYLTDQISQTSLSELQNVMYRIIEEHTKVITLAKVNDEYVLRVIDPAIPPEIRSKPNRKLIVMLGILFGGILGFFPAIYFKAFKENSISKV